MKPGEAQMMNQDEGFEQRWEVRSSNVDGDSSSDDEGSGAGAPTNKMVTDSALLEKDHEADDDDPRGHSHGDEKLHIHSGVVKIHKEKKSKKKANRKRKHSFNEQAALRDLKVFADSLVRELAVAHESMFARMHDEMRKLAASASAGKNVRGSERKVCAKIGTSQLRNQRNGINLINGDIPLMENHSSASRVEFCKLMAAKSLSQRFAAFKEQEQFGGFSLNYLKAWGLYGESRSSGVGPGVGLPAPLHPSGVGPGVGLPAPLHQGMVDGFSRSSLSYLADEGMLVSRFPSTIRAPSERMVDNSSIARIVSRVNEGEFQ